MTPDEFVDLTLKDNERRKRVRDWVNGHETDLAQLVVDMNIMLNTYFELLRKAYGPEKC